MQCQPIAQLLVYFLGKVLLLVYWIFGYFHWSNSLRAQLHLYFFVLLMLSCALLMNCLTGLESMCNT